jgi:hypothetical protein
MADFAAWFRREDYERIREIMEDSDRLPPSFDEWELLAKSRVAKAKRDGIILKPVMLDPDTFVAFCKARKMRPNGEARAKFAVDGRETTGSGSLLSRTRRKTRTKFERVASPSLARMLALVIGLRLREIAFRVLHKGGLSFLIAEAVSLALDRRIDRAIRGGVFAHGETLGAHVIKLTFRSCHRCCGETKH